MGDVKDAVKGTTKKKLLGKSQENLVTRIEEIRIEISDLIQKKDNDTLSEGETEKAENTRKAAHLRATHSLLTSAKTLLEDY